MEILGLIDNPPGMALSETSWLLSRTGAPVERIVFTRRPLHAAAARTPCGRWFRCLLWVAWLSVALPALAGASAADAPNQLASRKLVVGTKEAPPFAFKLPDGEWTGISIDLWRKVADDLNLDYEIRAFPLEDLITATHQEEVDVAVAAIGMTAQRNNLIEFSYPFFGTGLAMAVKRGETGGLWEFLHRLFSPAFLRSAGFLAGILLVTGVLIWAAEHRKNPTHFGGGAAAGIGSGFWWSAVTMTTVGYGDKAPTTVVGRFLALIWMFISLFALAGLTGAMASALTVTQLTPRIQGPSDLGHASVGALAGSTGAEYLTQNFILFSSFPDTESGLEAVRQGKIDTFVNDAPVLEYRVRQDDAGGLTLLPQTFDPGFYAFAFPRDSKLRRSINASILEITETSEWLEILSRYIDASRTHLVAAR